MPDDTTPATTTTEGADAAPAAEDNSALKARAEQAEARAASHAADADQAKRYLVDLVSRMGQNAEAANTPPAEQLASAEELIQEFKENPVGLLDRHFAARMGPVLHEHLDTQAKIIRQAFIDRNKEDWQEFGKEIDAFMQPMSMSTKAKPGSWEEGLNYIRGKHVDKLVEKGMKAKEEAEKRSQLEGRGTLVGGSNGSGRRVRLTETEKAFAKGFGMTEEEWVKSKTPAERGEVDEVDF
jgi:hypothetical protein